MTSTENPAELVATAGPAEWDKPRDPAWSLREIVEHVSHVTVYAEQIGHLDTRV